MTYPHERLAANPHHRASVHRDDEPWLDDHWVDPDARVLVIAGNRIRPIDGHVEWIRSADAPAGTRVLLGEHDGHTWWAVLVPARREEAGWLPLRALLRELHDDAEAETLAPLLFHAMGLAEWHVATRFCSKCGAGLVPVRSGHELQCTGCGRPAFPRTDPAVIMTVTHGDPGTADEAVLLGRRAIWPEHQFSTLAGFCEPGESLEDAVRREVLEEVGVAVGDVTYLGNQGWPFPASLMLGFTARALQRDPVTTEIEDEIVEFKWLTRHQLHTGASDGSLLLPGGVSISRTLIEMWHGGPLPGSW